MKESLKYVTKRVIDLEDFKKLYKDSSKEDILKQYYNDYKFLMELKYYRMIINRITIDTYIEPVRENNKRFIDEIINKLNGEDNGTNSNE